MGIINKDGKVFGIINIIDLGALILVLLILAAISAKFLFPSGQKNIQIIKEAVITVKCKSIEGNWVEAIKIGDKIMGNSTLTAAFIDKIEVKDAYDTATTANGEFVWAKHPVYKDVYVVIKLKTNPDTPSLKLGNQEYKVGSQIQIKTLKAAIPGVVDSIEFR